MRQFQRTAHRRGSAHAHTTNAAPTHRQAQHMRIQPFQCTRIRPMPRTRNGNTALQARLTVLSAGIAHATVYRHDLPCAKGSGAQTDSNTQTCRRSMTQHDADLCVAREAPQTFADRKLYTFAHRHTVCRRIAVPGAKIVRQTALMLLNTKV